ncbi:MAG: type II toxin-antitoxin system VapC family toxin, partial [Blastocatellia bacterium]
MAYSSPGLASCELARVEFHAVLDRHLREGNLTADEAREVIEDFEIDDADGVWQWIPVTSQLLTLVCDHTKTLPHNVFLRAVDAIHLTCASSHGFQEVYSNDRHLLAAAQHFNLTGRNII